MGWDAMAITALSPVDGGEDEVEVTLCVIP